MAAGSLLMTLVLLPKRFQKCYGSPVNCESDQLVPTLCRTSVRPLWHSAVREIPPTLFQPCRTASFKASIHGPSATHCAESGSTAVALDMFLAIRWATSGDHSRGGIQSKALRSSRPDFIPASCFSSGKNAHSPNDLKLLREQWAGELGKLRGVPNRTGPFACIPSLAGPHGRKKDRDRLRRLHLPERRHRVRQVYPTQRSICVRARRRLIVNRCLSPLCRQEPLRPGRSAPVRDRISFLATLGESNRRARLQADRRQLIDPRAVQNAFDGPKNGFRLACGRLDNATGVLRR